MANEKQKCPMCSTKLKMINGRMTCKDCGYYIRNPYEEGFQNTAQYPVSGQTGFQNTPQYHFPEPTETRNRSNHNGSASIIKKIVIAYVCLQVGGFLAAAILQVFFSFSDNHEAQKEKQEWNDRPVASEELKTWTPEDDASGRKVPESEFFRQLAEVIWEKDCEAITKEEYASLTALYINQDDKVINYQINNGDTHSLTYQSGMQMNLSDLTVFSGLQWLSVDRRLSKGDLKGLNNLYGIYADNTIEEYLDIIPNLKNIMELRIEDDFFEDSLEGIEAFPNLQYLTVNYERLEDISDLAKLPDLWGLYLVDCDRLSDYSALSYLTNLEELSIESTQLSSIDFVRGMPELNTLTIEDSQIDNLDALKDCTQLFSLELIDNSNLKDYSVVGELEQLCDLTLEMNYGGTLPSFEKLGQLQWLSIKHAGDLTPLKDAVSVTALRLERCSGWELEAIASMQELTTLSIHDFSSAVSSLEPLTRLPELEFLDLEGTSIFGNIEEIFGIPSLRYLYLDDCQVGIDFEQLPTNDTLELLSLNKISILYDPTYNNGNKVKLSAHYDMFQHFPNLTELCMVSTEIDNIEFVDMLPSLQYLDITNNQVTSLKPLENLSDFRTVWCGKNTIVENVSADSDIMVITSGW